MNNNENLNHTIYTLRVVYGDSKFGKCTDQPTTERVPYRLLVWTS